MPLKDKEKERERQRLKTRRYRARNRLRRNLLIKKLGGKCRACEERDYACIQFHHLEKYQHLKRFQLSINSFEKHKLEEFLSEAAICILLCANCHLKVHHGNLKEPQKRRKKIKITKEEWDSYE